MADVREIEKVAADWLARRDSGAWSDAEQRELDQWLASTDHFVEFARLEAAWQQANRLKALGAGIAAGSVPSSGQWNPAPFVDDAPSKVEQAPVRTGVVGRRGRGRWVLPWAVAATLAIAVSLFYWRDGTFGRDSHITPVGGLASIPMQDGSTILLNTDSQIRIADSNAERRIMLARGEAYFEVAHDAGRPFVVIAGEQRVTVLGTKFAVRRMENDEVSVAVVEGRVRVEPPGAGATRLPAAELAAGTMARSNREGVLIEEKTIREIEEHLSWRSGFLSFRETPLGRAAEEFNRYNARKIVIDDPAIADIRIGGHFRSTNVDVFVRLLEHDFPIRVESRGEKIVLTERGP